MAHTSNILKTSVILETKLKGVGLTDNNPMLSLLMLRISTIKLEKIRSEKKSQNE